MGKATSYISIFAISVFLLACSQYDETADTPNIIVEGWIEDGDFPVVILTTSLPVSQEFQDFNDMDNHLIRWAKVTVSDGKDTVMLTGKYTPNYFPPYIYTTGHMRGQVGKTYTLSVEYRNYQAKATTTIPPRPTIDSFCVERCHGSDTLHQIYIYFTDPPKEKNYYQLFTRVGTHTKQYLASYLGSIDDETLQGSTKASVYRGHQLLDKEYTPYFLHNDSVSIKFAQVDETSFRFWDDYSKSLSLSGNLFLATSQNVCSNIIGGMGYWCGYGATTLYIPISDHIKQNR